MFKNMLPQEAQVSRRSPSKMDSHFRYSFILRLKAFLNKYLKPKSRA